MVPLKLLLNSPKALHFTCFVCPRLPLAILHREQHLSGALLFPSFPLLACNQFSLPLRYHSEASTLVACYLASSRLLALLSSFPARSIHFLWDFCVYCKCIFSDCFLSHKLASCFHLKWLRLLTDPPFSGCYFILQSPQISFTYPSAFPCLHAAETWEIGISCPLFSVMVHIHLMSILGVDKHFCKQRITDFQSRCVKL